MIRWATGTVPVSDTWDDWSLLTDATSLSLDSGDTATLYILIYGDKTGTPSGLFSSGTTVNIKFHSANGYDYPKLVQLT